MMDTSSFGDDWNYGKDKSFISYTLRMFLGQGSRILGMDNSQSRAQWSRWSRLD